MAGSSVTLSKEKPFKVLFIGDNFVGKSSIILRYVNRFDKKPQPTIGVEFTQKTIVWDAKTVVRLQLWDIAGECQNYKVSVVVVFELSPNAQVLTCIGLSGLESSWPPLRKTHSENIRTS